SRGGHRMKSWKNALALAFAGVLVSTVAFAQATTPSGDQKAPADSDTTKSGAADMDKADKSGAMKSGASDTMMKSGKAAHGGDRGPSSPSASPSTSGSPSDSSAKPSDSGAKK